MQGDVADFAGEAGMEEVHPVRLMLVAMLCDQIQTLGGFYRMRLWRRDPAELGEWLRGPGAAMRKGSKITFLLDSVMREWVLWGGATDVLMEVLDRDLGIRVDRGRIIKLAQAQGEPDLATREARLARDKRRRREASLRCYHNTRKLVGSGLTKGSNGRG